jgi:hypothetical protein
MRIARFRKAESHREFTRRKAGAQAINPSACV